MKPNIEDQILGLIKRLKSIVDSKEGQETEVEVFRCFEGLALDIVCRNALGLKTDSINRPEDPLIQVAKEVTECRVASTVLFNINLLLPELTSVLYPIRYLYSVITEWLELTSDGILYSLLFKVLKMRKSRDEKIQDLMQILSRTKIREKDLMNPEINGINDGKNDEEKGDEGKILTLTDKQVVGNCLLLLFAAYDTTSTTLSLASHFMANHPLIQEQVRQEVEEFVSKEGRLDYNVVNGLPLMEAFLNEAMRFHPPAPMAVIRQPLHDFPYGNITLPKGVGIFVGVHELHGNPELWPEPDRFDPQRFLGENKQNIDPIAWQAFGVGPRNCIGLKFALLEIKLCLAHILREFRLESGPNTEQGNLSMGEKYFTDSPLRGVRVKLIPIHK
jgi:hypothetical protein